jgi:hypothetical protein
MKRLEAAWDFLKWRIDRLPSVNNLEADLRLYCQDVGLRFDDTLLAMARDLEGCALEQDAGLAYTWEEAIEAMLHKGWHWRTLAAEA